MEQMVFSNWDSLCFASHQFWDAFLFYYTQADFLMSLVIPVAVFNVILVLLLIWWRIRKRRYEALSGSELEQSEADRALEKQKYRFRKRDKIKYYSTKFLRGVKNTLFVDPNVGGQKFRRRSSLTKFPWFQHYMSTPVGSTPKRGLPSFLLETYGPAVEVPEGISPDVYYVLRSIKVFGHFEDISMWELCKNHVSDVFLAKDSYLFSPGMDDDSIFVVLRGSLALTIRDEDGNEARVKTVRAGESVISLLSVLDLIVGNSHPFKSVSAKALEDAKVLKVSAYGFKDVLMKKPDHMLHFVQTIIYRLLHVTLTTLHNYLGLGVELTKHSIRDRNIKRRNISGDKLLKPVKKTMSVSEEKDSDLSEPEAKTGRKNLRSSSLPLAQRPEDKESLLKMAVDELTNFFKLEEEEGERLLKPYVHVDLYPANFHILEQGSKDTSLLLVLSGSIQLMQKSVMGSNLVGESIVLPGEMVGGIAVMSAEPSYYTIKTRQAARVARIAMQDFYKILAEKPLLSLPVADSIMTRLSPFTRAVDFSLDWEMCEPGRAVFMQGNTPEYLHVVLTGRLRSVLTREDGSREMVEEFGRGDMVGMSEVFSQKPHTSTVSAIRYSELAKIPVDLLDYVKLKFPQVLIRMVQLMSQASYHQKIGPKMDLSLPNVMNLHTIAVMGLSPDVPLQAFCLELQRALSAVKSTLRLSSRVINETLGEGMVEKAENYRLFNWLNMKEDEYSVVMYQCDSTFTTWTKRCVRQADCVLLLANGDGDKEVGEMERILDEKSLRDSTRARKELVLLWREGTESPRDTQKWLLPRTWVSAHHHVRAPRRLFKKGSPEKILEYYETQAASSEIPTDLSRLARLLTGTSIGLVLGGGGARGAAHIGIIRAMQEAGVTVDIVAGVSIGSLIGGIYCENQDIDVIDKRAAVWFSTMTPFLNKLFDLTYPYSALLTGSSFNNTLRELFEEKQIEDLWIPYFCLSTDITSFETRVHKSGSLWRSVRGSTSYAGIFPPQCSPEDGHLLVDGCYSNNLPGPLWSYTRASMSLAGYLPPLCDPQDGHLLLDGGYCNNLPADVMRSLGVRTVIAVDVGAEDESNLTNYGDSLNGFWVLYNRWFPSWFPWTEKISVLSMGEIQSRLQYVSCVRQLETVKKAPYCRYIRPEIDKYRTMDFGLYEDIKNVGYKDGKKVFDSSDMLSLREQLNPRGEESHTELGYLPRPPSRLIGQSQSFSDLTEAMCKIPVRDTIRSIESSEEEEEEELSDVPEEEEGSDGGLVITRSESL